MRIFQGNYNVFTPLTRHRLIERALQKRLRGLREVYRRLHGSTVVEAIARIQPVKHSLTGSLTWPMTRGNPSRQAGPQAILGLVELVDAGLRLSKGVPYGGLGQLKSLKFLVFFLLFHFLFYLLDTVLGNPLTTAASANFRSGRG